MSDVVQVRAFAVSGPDGELDFAGFNRGYSQFFGTAENPQKPVRSFVEIAGLVVDGWLVRSRFVLLECQTEFGYRVSGLRHSLSSSDSKFERATGTSLIN